MAIHHTTRNETRVVSSSYDCEGSFCPEHGPFPSEWTPGFPQCGARDGRVYVRWQRYVAPYKCEFVDVECPKPGAAREVERA